MDLITVLVMRVMGILLGLSVCMIRPIEPIDNNDFIRNQLQNAAQIALDAIGSNAVLYASEHRAERGQHVFNNGLLKFHEKVLDDLQKALLENDNILIPDEKMKLLKQRLNITLSTDARKDIGDMAVHFGEKDFYVDYNACVYGEYMKQLRQTIVELLKSSTAIDCDRDEAMNICQRVKLIANMTVEHDVYVDPMARDHWLKQNKNLQQQRQQQYNQVRNELQNMFQNILINFREVYQTIHHFRRTYTWNR
nr:uncharacterized protein LOC129420989 [Misgurnus anguillicaudatus]XP_055032175.1 uncharacterized protein LOC129420989 [Misgurnus anguillicaudatus]